MFIEAWEYLAGHQAQFLAALGRVEDPECKRKMIGQLFIDVFEAFETRQIG